MQMMPVRKESWEELAEGALELRLEQEGGTKEEEEAEQEPRPGRVRRPGTLPVGVLLKCVSRCVPGS